jgi:uncharacterized protein YegP (UPF0339 family)
MTKWIRSLALASVFAIGAGTVVTLSSPAVLAQAAKGKPAVDPKKPEEPKKSAAKGSVIIKPDAKERFRISIKDEEGKTLLMSAGNGFATEKEARDAIEDIKAILASAKVTVEKASDK